MNQREMTIAKLKQAGKFGVSHDDFALAGIRRYSARIDELRKRGYVIETTCIDRAKGYWKSTLVSEPASDTPEPEEIPDSLFAAVRKPTSHYLDGEAA